MIKKIMFTFFGVILFLSFCFAQENVTLTAYYPSPYGVYRILRLYPFSPQPDCDINQEGAMYYDSAVNAFRYCDSISWQPFGGGYWKLDTTTTPNSLYLDSAALPDPNTQVGIGTTSPAAKLEVQGGPIKATGGLIIETRTSAQGDPTNPVDGRIWLRVP